MFKNVKINYPKKKTTSHESKAQGIQEPVRQTMYDIVLENFQIAGRNTYIHRIIYVGEHSFPGEDDMIIDCMQNTIDLVNGSYCLEKLTGFLLCYRKHFIHMVEADEDSINSHLSVLLNDKKNKRFLGVMKLLIHVSHISRRYITDWAFYKGIPPKLLGQIDPNSSLEDSGRQIYNCIKKFYNLVASYVDDNYFSTREKSDSLTEETSVPIISDPSSASKCLMSQMSFRPTNSLVGGVDPYRAFLPEIEVLNFVIMSTFTQNLSDYNEKYGVVPQRDIYKDKVWPVPSDFIPYDVFTKPYETITELPKPIAKIEEETIPDNDARNEDEDQKDNITIKESKADNGNQKQNDGNVDGNGNGN